MAATAGALPDAASAGLHRMSHPAPPAGGRRLAWRAATLLAALLGIAASLLGGGAARAQEEKPVEVTIGIYVNDIQELDLQNQSFVIDFYGWLRWTDPDIDPSQTIDIVNPYEDWQNPPRLSYPEPIRLPDGSYYQVIRYLGRFNDELPLQRFPFDSQSLTVEIEDSTYDASRLVYVPDTTTPPISMDPAINLPGYRLGTPTLTVSDFRYPTNFGDTSVSAKDPYSRVVFEVPVTRPPVSTVIKLVLPVLLVVLVAALVYLIQPEEVEARVGLAITALLTLVALQFSSDSVPSVEYLNALDLIYIAALGYVLVALATAVGTSWMAVKGRIDSVRTVDVRMLALSTLLFFATVAWIVTRFNGI